MEDGFGLLRCLGIAARAELLSPWLGYEEAAARWEVSSLQQTLPQRPRQLPGHKAIRTSPAKGGRCGGRERWWTALRGRREWIERGR